LAADLCFATGGVKVDGNKPKDEVMIGTNRPKGVPAWMDETLLIFTRQLSEQEGTYHILVIPGNMSDKNSEADI